MYLAERCRSFTGWSAALQHKIKSFTSSALYLTPVAGNTTCWCWGIQLFSSPFQSLETCIPYLVHFYLWRSNCLVICCRFILGLFRHGNKIFKDFALLPLLIKHILGIDEICLFSATCMFTSHILDSQLMMMRKKKSQKNMPISALRNSQVTCLEGWCLVCCDAHAFLLHEKENIGF